MKERFNAMFDDISSITSDEELLDAVLRKAEIMKENTTHKKLNKPVIAVCASVGIIAAGATGAAAAGLLDFNSLFGGIVTTDSQQLGEQLIGDAADVSISCSDEQYEVQLKGVTGTEDHIVASIEISRRDGGRVITNVEDPLGSVMWSFSSDDGTMLEYNVSDSSMTVNSEGAVEITLDLDGRIDERYTGGALNGSHITITGDNLYDSRDIVKVLTPDQNNERMHWQTVGDKFGMLIDPTGEAHSMDYMAKVQLEWSIEFDYHPSQKSLDSLTATDLSQPCTIMTDISAFDKEKASLLPVGMNIPIEAQIQELKLGADTGTISFTLDRSEYNYQEYMVITNMVLLENELLLIKKDGSTMTISFGGGQRYDGLDTVELEYRNARKLETAQAIDLNEIAAFSINGTVYELG